MSTINLQSKSNRKERRRAEDIGFWGTGQVKHDDPVDGGVSAHIRLDVFTGRSFQYALRRQ